MNVNNGTSCSNAVANVDPNKLNTECAKHSYVYT